jgi:hypothetical protein
METKSFREWAETGQFVPMEELTIDELRSSTLLPDTYETIIYEGDFIIQVNHKGIFSYNKEFISLSLLEVEKFIWHYYAKKNYTI